MNSAFEIFYDYSNTFIRMLLATGSGMLIGYTREKINRPAGLRTHSILSLGACILTILSINVFPNPVTGLGDPARLAAQIVSGIGFLGAGTILKHRNKVKGLTTAASLWVSSAIGITFGTGEYVMGITATLITFFIVGMRKKLSVEKKNSYTFCIEVRNKKIINNLIDILLSHNLKIKGLDYEHDESTFYIKVINLNLEKIPIIKKDILVNDDVDNIYISH